ncbi:LysR family transcriptional regulator [Bergeriella denitrificans]|uniref:LysR family transcriptional regulator n=1 Tax=Bergeriella denitrificans TaxID=494 RepID=A0A378UK74_BERDE|nr:LysR family transcriptional regulator [Bergeriella denitrificans]STZ76881.1 LysR family transcriptional regulator [Bergeriella denitrificans]
MDTLFSMKVFRQVVQNGSFTRAAEQLDISTAMASKHVSHLENTIQAKLLHRNSRNLHLTEAGEEYYRQCSYALDTLDTAAQVAAGGTDKPQGTLRVTMPLWFANKLLSRWLVEYRRRYPEVTLDLVLDNRHIDLIAEGFDLALRVAKTPSPSLIVKPLAKIEFVLVAAPDYLAEHGTPATPEEVMRHQAVLPSYTDQRHLEVVHRQSGRTAVIDLQPAMQTDNTLMVRSLVKSGGGIGYQPLWAVQKDLDDGSLVRLLPDYLLACEQLNAAYVDRTFLSAKVRSFIDFLTEKIHSEGI